MGKAIRFPTCPTCRQARRLLSYAPDHLVLTPCHITPAIAPSIHDEAVFFEEG